MYRADYSGRRPPAHITQLVTRLGGLSPFGLPNFRVVWSDDRLSPITGLWVDWPKGSGRKPFDKPLRRVFETRMKPRYPQRGFWVLEKWAHPRAYGPRARWYSPVYAGGTLIAFEDRIFAGQGEYPSKGEYEYTGFAFSESELTEAVLLSLITRYMKQDYSLPSDPLNRAKRLAWLGQQQAQAAEIAWEKVASEMIDDAMPAFGMNPRLLPGPKRKPHVNQVAERLGIRSHTGIS